MADATYVGPMTPELVEQILDKVRLSATGLPAVDV
jgi:carbamoylphosphate synthase large subunit